MSSCTVKNKMTPLYFFSAKRSGIKSSLICSAFNMLNKKDSLPIKCSSSSLKEDLNQEIIAKRSNKLFSGPNSDPVSGPSTDASQSKNFSGMKADDSPTRKELEEKESEMDEIESKCEGKLHTARLGASKISENKEADEDTEDQNEDDTETGSAIALYVAKEPLDDMQNEKIKDQAFAVGALDTTEEDYTDSYEIEEGEEMDGSNESQEVAPGTSSAGVKLLNTESGPSRACLGGDQILVLTEDEDEDIEVLFEKIDVQIVEETYKKGWV